jgi:hypothetical protein
VLANLCYNISTIWQIMKLRKIAAWMMLAQAILVGKGSACGPDLCPCQDDHISEGAVQNSALEQTSHVYFQPTSPFPIISMATAAKSCCEQGADIPASATSHLAGQYIIPPGKVSYPQKPLAFSAHLVKAELISAKGVSEDLPLAPLATVNTALIPLRTVVLLI